MLKFKGVRYKLVALLAEGVDRNIKHGFAYFGMISRPPRGGRG